MDLLLARFVLAASFGSFVVRICEAHGKLRRSIRKRRRAAERILDGRDDGVLVLAKSIYISALVEDYKQDYPAAFGIHLTDERTRAAVGAHQSSRLTNHTAALRSICESIFERAGIDSGHRQNV